MFSIRIDEVRAFHEEWNKNRLIMIPMEDHHFQFTTDFANVMLSSFIELCQRSVRSRDPLSSPEGNASMALVSEIAE